MGTSAHLCPPHQQGGDRFTGCCGPDVLPRGALVERWFYAENNSLVHVHVRVEHQEDRRRARWSDPSLMLVELVRNAGGGAGVPPAGQEAARVKGVGDKTSLTLPW